MTDLDDRIRAALSRYKVRTRWTVPFSERCKANARYAVFAGTRQVTELTTYGRAHADLEYLTVSAIKEIFADHCDTPARQRELAE